MPWLYIGIFGLAVLIIGMLVYFVRANARSEIKKEAAEGALKLQKEVNDAVDRAREHPVDAAGLGLRPKEPNPPPR